MLEQTTFFVDFDSTLVTRETLSDLADLALEGHPRREAIYGELEALTDLGLTGEMPFGDSLTARIALLGGIAHRDHIEALNEQLADQLSPSAVEYSGWFEANTERIHVISGGFEEIIIPTVARVGILASQVHANKFVFDSDGYIVGHDATRLTAQAGGKAVQADKLNIAGHKVAVGDGYTDFEIRQQGAADEFWAIIETVGERPNVAARADRIIRDFAELALNEPVY